jgi:cytochrome c peroxidase
MDGKRFSTGIRGQQGLFNAPTVFNSSFNVRQFWDGRAESLEVQINGPLTNPLEMDTDWPQVVAKLRTDKDYTREFAIQFPDGITSNNIASAIAEFERTLVTPNSRFDKYLRGDASAISAEEKQGYRLFKSYGCATCHQGAAVGGNMFERLGSVRDYFADHGPERPVDLGRYNVTRNEDHRHYFKVPSLRNVEKTAPYFHNGAAKTLEQAVHDMAFYNLGVVMPKQDEKLITLFLKTLTGEYEGKPL